MDFEQVLEIVKLAANGIFNDEEIGNCVYEVLEEGFEENDEVIEDLADYDDCTIISDTSKQIKENNKNIKYKWDESNDEEILYQLLIFIFKENIIDITTLIDMFCKQSLPNTLTECSINNILIISNIVAKKLNTNTKKPINIENIKQFITEQKLNGEALSNMKPKEFIDKAKKYKIMAAKGRKLFKGINSYWNDNKTESNEAEQPRWNTKLQSMKEATSSQIVYVLREHLFDSLNDERLNEYQLKIESYFATINGIKLFQLNRKYICNELQQICDQQKNVNGPSMKMLKELKAFDITKIPKTMPPDFTLNLFNGEKNIKDCNNAQIVYIANDIIKNDAKLNENKQSLISFLKEKKIDGAQIIKYDRKSFGQSIATHYKNTKIKGPSLKLLKRIQDYKLNTISIPINNLLSELQIPSATSIQRESTEYIEEKYTLPAGQNVPFFQNEHRDIAPKKLEECKSDHLVAIFNKHIFDALKQPLSSENRTKIILYIKESKLTGEQIKTMGRKKFGAAIAENCDDKKLKGPSMKLYKAINDFKDFNLFQPTSSISTSISTAISTAIPTYSPPPSSLEECNEKYMLKIINELMENEKMKPFKDQTVSYFKENNIDGVTLKEMGRKAFGQNIIKHCGDKKANGIAAKLYTKITKYDFNTLKTQKMGLSDPRSIESDISNEPLNLLKPEISRQSSTASLPPDNYDNLTCDVVCKIARDLTEKSLKVAHKKIQKCIKKNGIDGRIFMDEFKGLIDNNYLDTNGKFKDFFNKKLCDAKDNKDTKYAKFRKWLIEEIKQMDDISIITNKDKTDFIKFILDGFDEYIANIFKEKQINGQTFIDKGVRIVVAEINEEYGTAKGGITNLCHALEDHIKTDNAKYTKLKVSSSMRWTMRPSTRSLAIIDDEDVDNGSLLSPLTEAPEDENDNDFPWDTTVESMEHCNPEQIVFILRNYILPDLMDKEQIKNNKDKIIEYFTENKMNGKQILSANRKEFGKAIADFVEEKKLKAPAMKILAAFKGFDLNKKIASSPPNDMDEIKSVEDCNVDQVVHILDKHVFDKLNNKKLNEYRESIISYFNQTHLNGAALFAIKRKDFAPNIISHCNNDKKLTAPLVKLFKMLKGFDVTTISLPSTEETPSSSAPPIINPHRLSATPPIIQSETSFIWNDDINELKQCNYKHIVYILKKYIYPELKDNPKYKQVLVNKDIFISYLEEQQIDGKYVANIDRKGFAAGIAKFSNNKKLNGPSMKVYKLLKEFDFDRVFQEAKPDNISNEKTPSKTPPNTKEIIISNNDDDDIWSNNPSLIEECNVDQLIYMISNGNVFNEKPQLNQYKDDIIFYFKSQQIDGTKFKSMDRRRFCNDISTHLDDSLTLGSLGKLWAALNEYNLPSMDSSSETIKKKTNDVSWDNVPTSIDECTVDQLSYILVNYLLISDTFQKLRHFKSKIVDFMVENEYNGSELNKISRLEFAKKLTKHLGDQGILAMIAKLYKSLTDFDLDRILELKKGRSSSVTSVTSSKSSSTKPPINKMRKYSSHGSHNSNESSFAMAPIREDAPIIMEKHKSISPRTPNHRKSPSEPMIVINGKKMSPKKFRNKSMSARSTLNDRATNEQLAELNGDAFCEWVIKCVQNHPPSKTVKTMMSKIMKNQLSGNQLIKYIDDHDGLKDFIQDMLECNEIFFLQYLTSKIIEDYKSNKVPFENWNPSEFADYVQIQSYSFPSDAFKKEGIDGNKYCEKDSKFLLGFLRKQCGFRAGTARPLIANIDKYPKEPIEINHNIGYGVYSGTKRGSEKFDKFTGYNLHRSALLITTNKSYPGLKSNGFNNNDINIIDDAQSDASEFNEHSMSYSVNPRLNDLETTPEKMFAEHSVKIYKRENERHWRRIGERLHKVGIGNLLFHIKDNFIISRGNNNDNDDNDDDDDDTKSNGLYKKTQNKQQLDEKYFIKKSKLVYKIEVDRFYQELYKDIMSEALGFDISFNKKQATEWIIHYELKKLQETIMINKISKKRFQKEMGGNKDDLFCKQYMGFLPKKRRKVLWKKLKKDISKGKLNHM